MMTNSPKSESFEVDRDGNLVRSVVPSKGDAYEHRCPKASFAQIAHAIDELGEQGFSLESLHIQTQLPWTQIAVALAFLKERSCIVPVHGRKHIAASTFAFEDAMIEYHALAEGSPRSR